MHCPISYLSLSIHSVLIMMMLSPCAQAKVQFSYKVPDGFGDEQLNDDVKYIINFHGKILPDFARFSPVKKSYDFDSERYRSSGIGETDIELLKELLSSLASKQCLKGCDYTFKGQYISLDKTQRIINIRDASQDYFIPETHLGFVHSHSLDLGHASNDYTAFNSHGNGWLGLPFQSFGYVNWFSNYNKYHGNVNRSADISSWHFQKNFQSTYLRAGKQNSIDYQSGAVSTMLSPGFDKFITWGSQTHMLDTQGRRPLVLYTSDEGNFEIYRSGRLILKRPAVLGRNELDLNDLPGGYYTAEIRLVDRTGRTIHSEIKEISNINFNQYSEGLAWHLTYGKALEDGDALIEGALSKGFNAFYLNSEFLTGNRGRWASELNATRPGELFQFAVSPAIGVLSGERGVGGYASLSINRSDFGTLTASKYLNNDISWFYRANASTSFYYGRNIGNALVSYNFTQYSGNSRHQIDTQWSHKLKQTFITFSTGVQKGGVFSSDDNYGIYFNASFSFPEITASLNSSWSNGHSQISGDIKKDWQDYQGVTSLGVSASHINNQNNLNGYASREGTRGDVTLNLGKNSRATTFDANYRGMLAANEKGIALGRYSTSGSAMLVDTPQIDAFEYGFDVEGSPVGNNGLYSVPVSLYQSIPFAKVNTRQSSWDMNVEIPAYIFKAHPGQVYYTQAKVNVMAQYSGFLKDKAGRPVVGCMDEVKECSFNNGLFSITSQKPLTSITVRKQNNTWKCDLTRAKKSIYRCEKV